MTCVARTAKHACSQRGARPLRPVVREPRQVFYVGRVKACGEPAVVLFAVRAGRGVFFESLPSSRRPGGSVVPTCRPISAGRGLPQDSAASMHAYRRLAAIDPPFCGR